MKTVYKTCACVFCTLRISRYSAGAMSRIHVLASTNMDPLEDPHLRIHVSASLYLKLLCKIHVSGSMAHHPYVPQDPLQDPCLRFMSQHLYIYISGSSATSMSPDPCHSIHMYLRVLCKTHVSDSCLSIRQYGSSTRSMSSESCLSIFTSQEPLQDPCLRIHVSDSCLCIHQYGSSARSMSPDSCLSIFVSQDPLQSMSWNSCLSISVSQDSLQDPRLRIHVSASLYLMDSLRDPCLRFHVSVSLYLRILCKIHVSGSMSQHLCISGSSARSMSRIHVLASSKMDPLQDPRLRIHVSVSLYLRILCKIHVSGFMSQHLYISESSARSMSPDPCVRFMS